jgi:hypothetical protein
MAPPRPQPFRRGLPAAAELRFQLVELRVDGSLVVLPVAAGKLRAGFPLGFTLRVLRRGDLGLDVGHGSAQHGAAEVRHGRVDHLGIQLAHNRQPGGPPDPGGARDRAQRRLRLVDVAQVGQRPEAKPTGRPDQHAERSADDPDGQADESSAGRVGRNIDSTRSFSTTCPSSPRTTTTASWTPIRLCESSSLSDVRALYALRSSSKETAMAL